MTTICFVTYEIHPTTWGGCGVLLHNAAHVLLEQGHTVLFVLHVPAKEYKQFQEKDRLAFPQPENCRAYHVDRLCDDIPYHYADFGNEFLWRAYCFYHATEKVVTIEQPDIVEFFDYCGVAHYALAAKITQQQYQQSQLTIRLHTSVELMDQQEATKPHTFERYINFSLEHRALQFSESILAPSQSYLTKAYRPHYEAWFGNQILSKPPLIKYPSPTKSTPTEKKKILFLGKIYSLKGVDLFINAVISLMYQHPDMDYDFVLVGHDSGKAPDNSPTYQAYLRKKIPPAYQARFDFTGHQSWSQLANLLSTVEFAVFPTYFESFSYAVHEIYAAGIPLILNNTPAFEDFFKHEKNALFFDGTVSDLSQQIYRLATDADLRQQITRPYSLADNPLGNYYQTQLPSSWISSANPSALPTLTIVIWVEDETTLADTLKTISDHKGLSQIIVAHPAETNGQAEAVWWLGRLCNWFTVENEPLSPPQIQTTETLLILKSGDCVADGYIENGLRVLAGQPKISFVGAWKKSNTGIDTFPLDAALELLPFQPQRRFNRLVMRTLANQLLIDLFDQRLNELGEVGYLWHIEETIGPGVLIPEVMVQETGIPEAYSLNFNLISYLILRDTTAQRKKRLAHYLLSTLVATQSQPPIDTSRMAIEKLSHELAEIKATRGWQLLEHVRPFYHNLRTLYQRAKVKYF